MSDLPEGFTLDESPAAAPAQASLPDGFALDNHPDDVAMRLDEMHNASLDKPDDVAKHDNLARAAGTSYEVAKAIPDEVEKHINKPDWRALATGAPKTAEHLSNNPVTFQMAHDDTDNMAGLEKHVTEITKSAAGIPAAFVKQLASDFIFSKAKMFGLIGSLPFQAADKLANDADRAINLSDGTPELIKSERDTSRQDAYFEKILDPTVAVKERLDDSSGESHAEKFARKAGGMASFIADIMLTKGAGLEANPILASGGISMVPRIFNPEYVAATLAEAIGVTAPSTVPGAVELQQQVRDGGGSMGQAVGAAGMQWLTNAAGMLVPMASSGAALLERLGLNAASGVVNSRLATAGMNAALPDSMQTEQSLSNDAESAALSMLGGEVFGAHERWAQAKHDALQSSVAKTIDAGFSQVHAEGLNKALDSAANSKVRERSPAAYGDWLKQIADNSLMQELRVDPAALKEAGVLDKAAELSPSIKDQMDRALATGQDITVPGDEFLNAFAGADIRNDIVNHTMVGDSNMTLAEAKDHLENAPDNLKAEAEAINAKYSEEGKRKDQIDAIRKEKTQQLSEHPAFDGESARDFGDAYANMVDQFSRRMGIDPEVFAKDKGHLVDAAIQNIADRRVLRQSDAVKGEEGAKIPDAVYDEKSAPDHELSDTTADDIITLHKELGSNDDVFQYDRKVFDDMDSTILSLMPEGAKQEADDLVTEMAKGLAEEKGQPAIKDVKKYIVPTEELVVDKEGNPILRNGEKQHASYKRDAYIYINELGELWVDLSDLKRAGGIGGKIYTKAADYANSKGLVFKGDPEGLSDDALLKRTEHMASGIARRKGTASFVPHDRQIDPYSDETHKNSELNKLVRPIRWTKGNDIMNQREIVKTAFHNITTVIPELRHAWIDTDNARILYKGAPIDPKFRDWVHELQTGSVEPEILAGQGKALRDARHVYASASIKRQLLANTIARHAGESAERRRQVLDRLGELLPHLEDLDNRKVFYQKNDALDGARGAYSPEGRIIGFTEQANQTTPYHELTHAIFDMHEKLAAQIHEMDAAGEHVTEGQREIADDFDKLMEWHGVEGATAQERTANYQALSFEAKEQIHEKQARAGEQYFMTGEAPTVKLQPVFRRIAAKMLNFYGTLEKFIKSWGDTPVPQDVKDVMSRWFASKDDIQKAEEYRRQESLFMTREQAEKYGLNFDEYRAQAQAQHDEAVGYLAERSAKDMQYMSNAKNKALRALQREHDTVRRYARMEARQQVLSQPIYRAWQFLTAPVEGAQKLNSRARGSAAVDPSRDSLLTAIAKLGGLNRDEAVAQYGIDPSDYHKKGGVFGKPVLRREGGMSPDAMAEALSQHGYLPLDENGKWDIADLDSMLRNEAAGEPQYSSHADYDVLLGTHDARMPDDENIDFMGGRISRTAIHDMYDDIDLENMLKPQEQQGNAGLLMQKTNNPFPSDRAVSFGDFETGKPVTFNFIHNTESATKIFGKPKKDAPYDRGIEPSGRYVSEGSLSGSSTKNMISGELHFDNPLVLNSDTWKKDLYDHYKKTGKNLSLALIRDGYDGVVTVSLSMQPGRSHTSEILDLTTFDYGKALYQSDKYKPDLFVAHNLTAENLKHADELGGLAAPSLGVSRTTTGGFTGFGDITLLADKSILTDRDARTFNADVYSPRHPRAVHRIDDNAVSSLESEVNSNQGNLAGIKARFDSDTLERRGLDELLNNDALKNSFLVSKGILIKPKMKAVPDAVKQAIKHIGKTSESPYAYDWYNIKDQDWFLKLADKHYASEFEKWKSLRDMDFSDAELLKYGPYEADGSLKPYLPDQLARQVESHYKNGGQDSYANADEINKKFRDPKLEKEFVSYAEEKFAKISKEKRLVKYNRNGNAKYSPYTLENIVDEMTRKLQGGEGFNYGAGSVRSAYAFEFKHNTIDSIRSHKGDIVSKEEMNKIRDESNDKLADSLDKLRKFYKYGDGGFGYLNDASSAIAEGPKGQAEAFRMTSESKAIIKDLVDYLRALPSEYFETKMQRAVGIGEFKAAIVPKGTDQSVIDILERNGIQKIDYYDSKKPESRTKAIAKQKDLLFQKAPKDITGPRSLESLGVLSDEGLHPDIVAERFGLSSGDELIRGLLTQPDPVSKINDMTDQIMMNKYSDVSTPEARNRAANEAISGQVRARILATEHNALAKSIGKPSVLVAAAKAAAKRIIGDQKVGQLKPGFYAAAEARAAKASAYAFKKDRIADAAMQKRNQMVNNLAVREAYEAQKKIDKGLDYLKSFSKGSIRDKIDLEYRDQIDALLSRYDLRQQSPENKASLESWMQSQRDMGYEPNIADFVQDESVSRHYKDLTVDEFQALVSSIKSIQNIGRSLKRVKDGEKKIEIADAVAEANRQTADRQVIDPKSNRGMTAIDKGFAKLDAMRTGFDASLLKMEQMMDWLDDKNPDGVFNRLVFRRIADAQVKESDLRTTITRQMRELRKSLDPEFTKRFNDRLTIPELIDSVTGKPSVLWKKELLSIALNVGNDSNYSKLLKGEGWTDQGVQAALDRHMTKADWDFVQGMWKSVGSLWPEIEGLERRLGNTVPPKIEGRIVKTKFGDIQGEYFPVMYDPERSYDVEQRRQKSSDALFENNYQKATTQKGHTNARVQNYARPLWLSLDAIPRHINQVIHDLAFREAVMDADRLMAHPGMREVVERTLGKEYYKQVRPWLQSIANDKVFDARGLAWWDRAAHWSRTSATMVGLGYRATTMMIHGATAASNSVGEIGSKWFAKGLKDTVGSPDKMVRARDFIFERSGEMRNRMNEVDRDVREQLKEIDLHAMPGVQGAAGRGLDNVRRFAYYGIAMLDMASALPTWMGAYTKALHEGMEEVDASYVADKAVRNAHGGTGVKDLAAIQRGPEFQKLFTMFYSFWNHFYNRQRDIGRDVNQTSKKILGGDLSASKDFPMILARSFFYFAVPMMLHAAIKPPAPGHEDDDENLAMWFAEEMLLGQVAGIPVIRDIAASAASGRDYSVTPAASIVANLGKTAKDIKNLVTGEPADDLWLKHSIITAGYVFGLPTGQAGSTAQFLWDVSNGAQNPEDLHDWYSGLVHGRTGH